MRFSGRAPALLLPIFVLCCHMDLSLVSSCQSSITTSGPVHITSTITVTFFTSSRIFSDTCSASGASGSNPHQAYRCLSGSAPRRHLSNRRLSRRACHAGPSQPTPAAAATARRPARGDTAPDRRLAVGGRRSEVAVDGRRSRSAVGGRRSRSAVGGRRSAVGGRRSRSAVGGRRSAVGGR